MRSGLEAIGTLYSRSLTPNATTRYYSYSAGTNRLAQIRIGSTTGAIESSFNQDLEGRLVSQSGLNLKTLTWDAKGRLKTLNAETYSYDPMDYRIQRSGGSLGNLAYFLEGEHLESVYDASGIKERYLRGSSIDELVAGYLKDTDGKTKPFLFHHDNVNSVSQVSGHNGGVIQATTYSAFGEIQGVSGASPSRLKYTGREDDGTGLYYYRARYYDPQIGRFISEDPMGFDAGINFYAYVGNNPLNANDPTGLATKITIGYTKTSVPGLFHQFVILTDTVTGKQFATRAGPECTLCGKGPLGSGVIVAQAKDFNSDFKDYNDMIGLQPVGVISRDFADSVNNAKNFRDITNQNKIGYFPTGPNSNSYASTFIQSLTGVRPQADSVFTAPGESFGFPDTKLNYSSSFLISNTNVAPSTGSSFYNEFGFDSGAAAGGFLIYPNKSNTNQLRAVYSK